LHKGFAADDSISINRIRKEREAIRSERELAMAKIFTPEQLAQLDKIRVEKGQKANKKGQFGLGHGQLGFRQGGLAAGQGRGQMMGQGRGQMMGQGRGQMMGQGRGQMGQGAQMRPMAAQMMNKRAQMMSGRSMQHRRMAQMDGRPIFNKKDAKAFQMHAKRMQNAPMINPEVRIKNQMERMTKELDLTPEQAAKIQAIQTKHFKKEIAKFKKQHRNLGEIKAVLTPEQLTKLDAMNDKAPRMQPKKGRMYGPMNDRH